MTHAGTSTTPAPVEHDSTRAQVLRLIVEEGPVSVVHLATDLGLTPPGVRRHVAALEESGDITVHTATLPGRAGRGRPARRYVATPRGHAALTTAYSELAVTAMEFLDRVGGSDAVREFADQRVAQLEERLAPYVERAGSDPVGRVAGLADGLAQEGYAASVRPLPGGRAIQLCQGHCPVQAAAHRFGELCDAEARMFSRLLGVHVQRLSTLASGGHVCTTHVPVNAPASGHAPATTVEGR